MWHEVTDSIEGATMDYKRLGNTGLQVSQLCLGCMTYGDPNRGKHAWTLPEDLGRPLIRRALDLGINFFDTANSYSDGSSEEILGRALRDFARREDIVIATKVHSRMRPGPNGAGLSRKAIMTEVDASLRRLGTDYIDLYQTHRWDYQTPIEETLEALHDLVKAGKKIGLPQAMVKKLTLETVLGAALMVIQTGLDPEELRSRVTSKKGTTWAATKVLKKFRFWDMMVKAIEAATKRAGELRKI